MSSAESALVVLVPEADGLLREFRVRYDPQAPIDVPAHVTLLYPFLPPGEIKAAARAALARCCAGVAAFDSVLAALRCFPADAAYLAPEPDEPFRLLTLAICRRYPQLPPYGGRWRTIVPHLTLARIADAHRLAAIAEDFAVSFAGRLPIRARAAEVALLDTVSGRWEIGTTFPLGQAA